MITIKGPSVFSSAQSEKLIKNFSQLGIPVEAVFSEYVHFVHASSPLDDSEVSTLDRLMQYGSYDTVKPPKVDLEWTVIPRLGTISPWSSKATDIVKNCGLIKVERVERGRKIGFSLARNLSDQELSLLKDQIHDKMIEEVIGQIDDASQIFGTQEPAPLKRISLGDDGFASLSKVNQELGLALTEDEIVYLVENYRAIGRDPSDVELMMFAQANSEHCRHKIFNGSWTIDGEAKAKSLFNMIRNTHQKTPDHVLSAYKDNAAVMEGYEASRFFPDTETRTYGETKEPAHILMKVETHNHPTAISPYPGASTGSGGEIRDEGATGLGGKPKVGLTGFCVSNLRIPGQEKPWEQAYGSPARIASALDIMLEGPLGGAGFNNEFGRPNVCGMFRTYEQEVEGAHGPEVRGYHKPIMLAGGLGNVRDAHAVKSPYPADSYIIVLGGPAMLIGLGGGAASSQASGDSHEDLDFASVQRDNPEMQRRCQEVIDRCWAMGEKNPISYIHDVGAGGLSNAVPEIIHDAELGGVFDLRKIPSDDPGMSPLEIWCNESQERYVLAVQKKDLDRFQKIADRERCPFAILGTATSEKKIVVEDPQLGGAPIDLDLEVLLGKPPKMERNETSYQRPRQKFTDDQIQVSEAIQRVLNLPTVGDKTFLITIGDRTVSGLVARDQMVGPWQVPVADAAVSLNDFNGYAGEAMSMGERSPLALLSPKAAAKMAVCEAITNMGSVKIPSLKHMKLSANWQAAPNVDGDGADLYEAVEAVGEDLCPQLGLSIPVGKDSMSMNTTWEEGGQKKQVLAPVSLVISAFAPVKDVRKAATPALDRAAGSRLMLCDMGLGQQRLGGSCLAQVYNQLGDVGPDVDDPESFKTMFNALQQLMDKGAILAYHDRSDGGLLVTLVEMAFAGNCGLAVDIASLGGNHLGALFAEELGVVIQVSLEHRDLVRETFDKIGLGNHLHDIGTVSQDSSFRISDSDLVIYESRVHALRDEWSSTTRAIQSIRDNPVLAEQEHQSRLQSDDPGMTPKLTFEPCQDVARADAIRPKVAILREQGVNGQIEMAAAFHLAGFEAIDVHMTDLRTGQVSLKDFDGLVACGGFSYGDVLGAGEGWAKSILFNDHLRQEFMTYFARPDTFTLGVCNGCQMLSALKELIPGAESWPRFVRNLSDRFEARVSMVKIKESPSLFFKGMVGSEIPIAVAHGEGRVLFADDSEEGLNQAKDSMSMQFVDHHGKVAVNYPRNPNGSPDGMTAFTSADGRATIMMPHPERVFRTVQNSWHPKEWQDMGPWFQMFVNARQWVDSIKSGRRR